MNLCPHHPPGWARLCRSTVAHADTSEQRRRGAEHSLNTEARAAVDFVAYEANACLRATSVPLCLRDETRHNSDQRDPIAGDVGALVNSRDPASDSITHRP